MVEVELWSTDPEAVKAVRDTLTQIRPGGLEAKLEEINGKWYLDASYFVVWACQQQGYVKRLVG